MSAKHKISRPLSNLTSRVSIELLPGDGSEWPPSAHSPFLFIDKHLGVPRKVAYALYVDAVRKLLRLRPSVSSSPVADIETVAVLESSSIVLLVNPAHLLALNTRKRLLKCGLLDHAHELSFTDALLTLHEGAKESLLWHHRRWLLRLCHAASVRNKLQGARGEGMQRDSDTLEDLPMPASAFRREFAVVSAACELYPRNYHAWTHRFLCASALLSLIQTKIDQDTSLRDDALISVLAEEIAFGLTWIERHVSDYSAVQYSCRLHAMLSKTQLRLDSTNTPIQQLAHALDLVRAYPNHESLWLYLRYACIPTLDFTNTTSPYGLPAAVEQFVTSTVDTASEVEPDSRRHANRFLEWTTQQVGRRQYCYSRIALSHI